MLRRKARLRREYIYRKSIEAEEKAKELRREKIRHAIENNQKIPTELQREAIELGESLDWVSEKHLVARPVQDDEYRFAGVEDPKVVVTTSRDPTSRLMQFSKEMKLLIPNSQRINRGRYDIKQLLDACRSNGVTDLVMLQETRGRPDALIVCHLPLGPTAYFTLNNVVMRHDIPDIGTMSEQYPHLIFDNFKTPLGNRVKNILKYLFPVPKPDSKKVVVFANNQDYVSFRHYSYSGPNPDVNLKELGPRFEMHLYAIRLGTLDAIEAAEVEWEYRPYMNTTKKRQFLSTDEDITNV